MTANAAEGGKLGVGLSKSDILAARQARKAEAARSSRGPRASGRAKWSLAGKTMVGTATGIGVLGVAWHFKADEIRALLDDTPIDHAAVWVVDKVAEVRLGAP